MSVSSGFAYRARTVHCGTIRYNMIYLLTAIGLTPGGSSKGKGTTKAIPLQASTGPEASRRFRLPDFQDSLHMKVVNQLRYRVPPVATVQGVRKRLYPFLFFFS